MKVVLLALALCLLTSGTAFTGTLLDQYRQENQTHTSSDYKRSATTDFHSNTPEQKPNAVNGTGGATGNTLYGKQPNDLNNNGSKYGSGRNNY